MRQPEGPCNAYRIQLYDSEHPSAFLFSSAVPILTILFQHYHAQGLREEGINLQPVPFSHQHFRLSDYGLNEMKVSNPGPAILLEDRDSLCHNMRFQCYNETKET
jgi:hypothetical protein